MGCPIHCSATVTRRSLRGTATSLPAFGAAEMRPLVAAMGRHRLPPQLARTAFRDRSARSNRGFTWHPRPLPSCGREFGRRPAGNDPPARPRARRLRLVIGSPRNRAKWSANLPGRRTSTERKPRVTSFWTRAMYCSLSVDSGSRQEAGDCPRAPSGLCPAGRW